MIKEKFNKILIGDCTKILKTLDKNIIDLCITDPPYNYEFIGKDWNDKEINRRIKRVQSSKTLVKNIPYGSGLAGGVRNQRWYKKFYENTLNYQKWICNWGEQVFRITKPGAFVAVFNSTRSIANVQTSLEKNGFYTRDIIVYRRSSGIPKGVNMEKKLKSLKYKKFKNWNGWHSYLLNEWEAILVVQKPLNNNYHETLMKYGVGLFNTRNQDGKFQSNILENFKRDKKEKFNVHCTIKPLALMKKLITMMAPLSKKSIILDPFAGSGTTLLAAKQLGCSYVGIEIEKEYEKIILQRLKNK